MENTSSSVSAPSQAAGPLDVVTQLPEDWRLARAAHSDLLHMGLPRVNLLLIGVDRVTGSVIDALQPDLHDPVVAWFPGEPLVLPNAARTGTLILHDVGALPVEDQLRLFEWLGRCHGRVQVVSTTQTPLLPRVHAGAFIELLYYRLNTVCVDVGA